MIPKKKKVVNVKEILENPVQSARQVFPEPKKEAKDFIFAHPAFCKKCKYLKRCQGGCKASAESCFGEAFAENPFLKAYKSQAKIINNE